MTEAVATTTERNPTMEEVAKQINEALDKDFAHARVPLKHAPLKAVSTTDQSELERFMDSAERLREQQRHKVLTMESRNKVDRVRLLDDYRVRIENLVHEASEAVRAFDEAYRLKAVEAREILDKLTAMRGK